MRKYIVIFVVGLFVFACNQKTSTEFPAGQWIDLSHDFSDETIYWVTAEPFKRTTVSEGKTPGGFYYSAYNFSGAEHGGTHLDSPIHFAEGKKTVDQIEIQNLVGEGVKIDVSAKSCRSSRLSDLGGRHQGLGNHERQDSRMVDHLVSDRLWFKMA